MIVNGRCPRSIIRRHAGRRWVLLPATNIQGVSKRCVASGKRCRRRQRRSEKRRNRNPGCHLTRHHRSSRIVPAPIASAADFCRVGEFSPHLRHVEFCYARAGKRTRVSLNGRSRISFDAESGVIATRRLAAPQAAVASMPQKLGSGEQGQHRKQYQVYQKHGVPGRKTLDLRPRITCN